MGRRWSLLRVLGTIEIIILFLSALGDGAIQIIVVDELIYFVKRLKLRILVVIYLIFYY
jgi:hypothetical protein